MYARAVNRVSDGVLRACTKRRECVETEREGIQRGKTGSEYMYKAERESFICGTKRSLYTFRPLSLPCF